MSVYTLNASFPALLQHIKLRFYSLSYSLSTLKPKLNPFSSYYITLEVPIPNKVHSNICLSDSKNYKWDCFVDVLLCRPQKAILLYPDVQLTVVLLSTFSNYWYATLKNRQIYCERSLYFRTVPQPKWSKWLKNWFLFHIVFTFFFPCRLFSCV